MSLSPNNKQERRQNRRQLINVDVLIMRQKETEMSFSGKITNISDTGAYLNTNAPFFKGDQLDLTIYFQHGTNNLSITVPCTVARIDMNGIGIKSPHIDAKMLMRFELIFNASKEDTKQLIEDLIKAL